MNAKEEARVQEEAIAPLDNPTESLCSVEEKEKEDDALVPRLNRSSRKTLRGAQRGNEFRSSPGHRKVCFRNESFGASR